MTGPVGGSGGDTVTGWEEYLAASRQLDTVRRQATATVAAQQAAATVALEELGGIRQRIALQRSRLTDIAGRLTRTPPPVEPLASERIEATWLITTAVPDPTPEINAALQGVRATLDAADATLSDLATMPPRSGLLPDWSPTARNALAYGGYAVLWLIFLSFLPGGSPQAKVVETGLAIIVPAGVWALGWVSTGLLFGPDRYGRKPRSAVLGAAICVLSLFAGLMLSLL